MRALGIPPGDMAAAALDFAGEPDQTQPTLSREPAGQSSTEDKALARLINDAKDARRLSYREMQERAGVAGYYVSFQQLQNYARGMVRKAPDPEQVAAIAAAIGEPIEQVRDAVFEQFYGVPKAITSQWVVATFRISPPGSRGIPG